MAVVPAHGNVAEDGRERRVAVIGGGAVGVCSCIYLLWAGFDVTLIDPVSPGSPSQCSFGNAGSIATGSCVPNALPGLVWQLPKLLMDPESPFSLRLLDLPHALPWLARFLWAGRSRRVDAIADAMMALNRHSLSCYLPLVQAANCEDLIKRRGQLFVYEDPRGADPANPAARLRRERGVRVEILNESQLREIEPAIGPAYRSAIYLPDNGQCSNPGQLVASLWKLALDLGCRHVRSDCRGLLHGDGGPVAARTELSDVVASQFVISAGVRSTEFMADLGLSVPLIAERGYHLMVESSNIGLRIQTSSASRKFSAAPMDGGLRLAGTAEFARLKAPPRWERADMLARQGRHMFPDLDTTRTSRWIGSRPSTPDSIPVIERSARHDNVILAFGHGHQGLIGASVTGRLVSELAARRPTCIDLHPYRASRF